ncbi:nitroreductase family protein [Maridesulfovibrio bastinii]|uniref:nitroreductase family protein n=1 Tax=Maridesulfovibrio bastinii TaxID=47157 RepID=UPI00041B9973|nr:nitroreductase family protein [Maridesulfovibrio bastinii]
MIPVKIDSELCRHDNLCVNECPLNVLEIKDENGVPSVSGPKGRFCINCGHCVAICPANAISLTAFDDSKGIPFKRKELISAAEAELFLKTRRSVRKFKQEAIDQDKISELINICSYAPSGHNARPVSWSVLNSKAEMEKLTAMVIDWMEETLESDKALARKLFLKGIVRSCKAGNDIICRNAPAIAVAWSPLAGITPASDAIISASHLELAAHAENIGACWAGYVTFAAQHSQPICDFLGVEADNMVHASLLMGKPAVKYFNIPPRPVLEPEQKGSALVFKI